MRDQKALLETLANLSGRDIIRTGVRDLLRAWQSCGLQ